ncbi:hypothetical protein OEA41_010640 [Lepraria neglecta]|uniref:Yeast cell wall synthesis Kre9/Knh1-like N-terminal domain-containing protein n=1 Tax=Lepraria neglecta TaxID=209136 RepID=A0AAD9Z166_9LECA|nr:hypothetical protein OEA41_010640 [Lepraria neglecta]
MLFNLLVLLAAVAPYTLADVQFTFPTAGAQETGNTAVYIAWKESGTGPAISSFGQYNLSLCAGGNDAGSYAELSLITEGGYFGAGSSASDTVSVDIGESIQNAYFLQMNSSTPGGTVMNFSDRFSLSGMTGTFPPKIRQGAEIITGTDGPAAQNNIAGSSSSATSASTVPSTTLSPTPTSSPPPTPAQKSSGLSSSAKIGIGLGVPLGIIILAFAAFLGYRYGKRGTGKAMAPTVEAQSHATSCLRDAPVSQKQGWRGLWTSREYTIYLRTFHPVRGFSVGESALDAPYTTVFLTEKFTTGTTNSAMLQPSTVPSKASSPTSTSSPAPTILPTSPPPISQPISTGLKSSAKIGIGLGIPLGVMILAFIAFLVHHRRNRRSVKEVVTPTAEEPSHGLSQ